MKDFLMTDSGRVVFTVVFIVGVLVLLGLFGAVIEKLSKKYFPPKCPHGIRDGKRIINGKAKCPDCQLEIERKLKALEDERKQKELELENKRKKQELQEKYLQSLLTAINNKKSAITTNEETLLNMHPKEFEDMVAGLYRKMNYSVVQTPYVNDGGKDAILEKNGIKYYLECKRYSHPVGRPLIQKLVGAMNGERIGSGIFVTTSDYTQEAITYAKRCNVELIDKTKLINLCKLYMEENKQDTYTLSCPECGEMIVFKMFNDCSDRKCINGHIVHNVFWEVSPNDPICHYCGHKLVESNGRYGKYLDCSNTSCALRISSSNYWAEIETGKPHGAYVPQKKSNKPPYERHFVDYGD